MTSNHQELLTRAGMRVKHLRETHGVTLAQLSARTGVAKSTIFQLEAGTGNPTVSTLAAIANALTVSVSELLDSTPEEEVVVVRAGEGEDVSGATSVGRLMQTALVGPSRIEVHQTELQAGTHESSPSHGAGSREHVLVTSGSLLLGPEGQEVRADPGDYVSYPGDHIHHFTAVGEAPCHYWIVATFPRIITDL